ncbi:hypothetical protein KIW84_015649 [Lathyrus oleraceus]|uniref:Uncharacterized protein n=1 Tax=Pisum sativum TaxID=3888 RepID=A0A9D5H0Q4_PEA|nr:hypothetical protein KIW84_015649 [Pisum sativum]
MIWILWVLKVWKKVHYWFSPTKMVTLSESQKQEDVLAMFNDMIKCCKSETRLKSHAAKVEVMKEGILHIKDIIALLNDLEESLTVNSFPLRNKSSKDLIWPIPNGIIPFRLFHMDRLEYVKAATLL